MQAVLRTARAAAPIARRTISIAAEAKRSFCYILLVLTPCFFSIDSFAIRTTNHAVKKDTVMCYSVATGLGLVTGIMWKFGFAEPQAKKTVAFYAQYEKKYNALNAQ